MTALWVLRVMFVDGVVGLAERIGVAAGGRGVVAPGRGRQPIDIADGHLHPSNFHCRYPGCAAPGNGRNGASPDDDPNRGGRDRDCRPARSRRRMKREQKPAGDQAILFSCVDCTSQPRSP